MAAQGPASRSGAPSSGWRAPPSRCPLASSADERSPCRARALEGGLPEVLARDEDEADRQDVQEPPRQRQLPQTHPVFLGRHEALDAEVAGPRIERRDLGGRVPVVVGELEELLDGDARGAERLLERTG